MKLAFLGSSVTYGFASNGISFVELLCEKNGYDYIKETVSGTTLVDSDENSYISRLKRINKNEKIDLFIVQLSTNDASRNFELKEIEKAVKEIINYINVTFACKIIFYSNPYYLNDNYQKMVNMMYSLDEDFVFINMYSDSEFNNISNQLKNEYMADDIHPTLKGYQEWLMPYIEKIIKKTM